MSMFKRMLASVGIGAARVNLMLHDSSVSAGGTLTGVVSIQGGDVDQQVDDVYAYLKTHYVKERNDSKVNVEHTITKYQLTGKLNVAAGQTYELPVSLQLPPTTPVTWGRVPVWIQTGLDIKNAFDPEDQDRIQVTPHPDTAIVLEAVQRHLGFRLREVELEYAPRYSSKTGLPFVQEFEFVPATQFRGQLDELEIFFFPHSNGVELLLQIDRKARGWSGWLSEKMNMDESFVKLNLDRVQLNQGSAYVAQQLKQVISRYA
ncbi:sporulation protein [Paenibacillus sp. SYP-B4298]|uniref:sporulation protein n=1 Tax=Paenibacillus sp. SYP-B4298 TaxID=2996034 RepID=UPI0022DE559A|nr:sporulation protein [Paenibacillus sp. SYP-B4298]